MSERYTPGKGDYIKVQGNKQYLPVPQRVQWFRGEHPTWTLDTRVIELNWAEGYAVMRAEVRDDSDRLIASGTKTETRKGFGDFVEKAETGAVGRALARAGYGTEDALDLEGDRLADAPIEQPGSRGATASSPRVAPAADLRHQIAQALKDRNLEADALEPIADELGIPKGARATDDQLRAMLARIEKPERATDAPVSAHPAPAEPTMEQILEVSGGEEIPPRPNTPEYGDLKPAEKATARAYWAAKDKEAKERPDAEQLIEAVA